MINSVVPTPNSRLLYIQTEPESLDLVSAEWELSKIVDSHPRLQMANEYLYLYFFRRPNADGGVPGPMWVGREVVGFAQESEVGKAGLRDLDHGEAIQYQFDEALGNWSALYNQVAAIFDADGSRYADTWRIRLKLTLGDEKWPVGDLHFFNSL